MPNLSAPEIGRRETFLADPRLQLLCDHAGPGMYFPRLGGMVVRGCRRCATALVSAEPRCEAQTRAGRRCLAPARHGSLCRAHRHVRGTRMAAFR